MAYLTNYSYEKEFPPYIGRYKVLQKVLGKGSFGYVKLGQDEVTKEKVAIKQMRAKKNMKYLESEVEFSKKLDHPHIVKLLDYHVNKGFYYLVFEYMDMDLSKLVAHKKLPEEIAQNYLSQIASGLKYMRDRNIVHRDLKPNNILVKKTNHGEILKISDFGFTRSIEDDEVMNSFVGTGLYMAPEIHTGKYTSSSDLYSVGVMFYQFLTGDYRLLRKPIRFPTDVSPKALDLLRRLLQPEEQRIKWDEFFAHPFLKLNETEGDILSWMQDLFYFNNGYGTYHQLAVSGNKNIEYLKKSIKNELELPIAYHDLMILTRGDCLPDNLVLSDYVNICDKKIPEFFVVDRSNFHTKYHVNFEFKKHYVEEILNEIKIIGFCERRIAKALRDYCLNQLEQHLSVSEILYEATNSLVELEKEITKLINESKDFTLHENSVLK